MKFSDEEIAYILLGLGSIVSDLVSSLEPLFEELEANKVIYMSNPDYVEYRLKEAVEAEKLVIRFCEKITVKEKGKRVAEEARSNIECFKERLALLEKYKQSHAKAKAECN